MIVWCSIFARVAYFYYIEGWCLNFIISELYVSKKSLYTVWYQCATSSSQPGISRYYRPCSSFYIFATGGCYVGTLPPLGSRLSISLWLTRTQAGFYLFLFAQYRVISKINTINSMQMSCFFVLQYLNSITSITGGGGSDFVSSQTLASSEQISFSLFLFRMRVSGSRHLYNFVSSESGNTLLLLN